MIYAVDLQGNRIAPTPGAQAQCGHCHAPMIPKCGRRNMWHWAHHAGDCDTWSEGETDWHRQWKTRAPRDWCEVTLPPHRADIRRSHDGLIIELQHSSISPDEIEKREAFYGNMWWLFDATTVQSRDHIRFFRLSNGRWAPRQLNYRGKYDFVKKPMYWDLGGPILAFDEPFQLRPKEGYIRLLSRAEFLRLAGLSPLTLDEAKEISHYVVSFDPYPHGVDAVLKFSIEAAAEYAVSATATRERRDIIAYRMDGSAETVMIP